MSSSTETKKTVKKKVLTGERTAAAAVLDMLATKVAVAETVLLPTDCSARKYIPTHLVYLDYAGDPRPADQPVPQHHQFPAGRGPDVAQAKVGQGGDAGGRLRRGRHRLGAVGAGEA